MTGPADRGEPTPALDARLAELAAAVDASMRRLLDGACLPASLDGMLRYHLGWVDEQFRPATAPRGKHIRPAVCLLACEAAGAPWPTALASATAVELLHNFSLIHDDIEDESPLRRHRPTLWTLWGVPTAINAGDALLILAQLAILEGESPESPNVGAAARLLNRACLELCMGQHRDLTTSPDADPALADYLAMIEGKTAALLAAAAQLGALAAGADLVTQQAYARFAREIGLAFQLQDDVLDVWGSAARTGKAAGEDLRARKYSLPIVLAFELADPEARAELRRLYAGPAPLPHRTVAALAARMTALGVREQAERLIRRHHDAALAALADAAPRAEAAGLLTELAEGLANRQA